MIEVATASELTSLAPREIGVLRRSFAVDDAALARYATLLDEREQKKAARYVFDRDRRSSIVSRGTLRELLGRLVQREPASLRFVEGEQGKPALADGALDFNVSHTHGWLYIAVAPGRRLGVDVEGGERELEVDELAPVVFTPGERAELTQYAGRARRDAFLRGWTRKEAYVKVRGGGLSLPLQEFSVSLGTAQRVELRGAAVDGVTIVDLPAPAEHAAALAWMHGDIDRIVLV